MRKRGFTLIELLVVIAIIAILAAILFPVFTSAKARGRQVTCLNNLKQLGSAFRLYADDNDGRYPACSVVTSTPGEPLMSTPTDWCGSTYLYPVYPEHGQTWKYTKNRDLYICPVDRGVYPKDPNMKGKYVNYALSYSMNSWLSLINVDAKPNRRLSRIMLLVHESRNSINDGKFSMWSTQDIPSDVHYEGTTALYCDGHARYGSQKAFIQEKKSYWNPNVIPPGG